MDWIYGYLAALRHLSIVDAAELKWEISDCITATSVLATLVVGYITFLVSRSAAKAAGSAAEAAKISNNISEVHQLYQLRTMAVEKAVKLMPQCMNYLIPYVQKNYVLAHDLEVALSVARPGSGEVVQLTKMLQEHREMEQNMPKQHAALVAEVDALVKLSQRVVDLKDYDLFLDKVVLLERNLAVFTSDVAIPMENMNGYLTAIRRIR